MALSDWLGNRNKVANRSNTVSLGRAKAVHSAGRGLGTCAYCPRTAANEARTRAGKMIKVCRRCAAMLG